MTSIVPTVAVSMAIVSGIYLLRPEIGAITVTIAASMIAFLIGRAFSPPNSLWASASPPHGGSVRGFHRTAAIVDKRPAWRAPIQSRELAHGDFRVEDWQHAECA